MDADDSGRVDYGEFAAMLREKLRMRPSRRNGTQKDVDQQVMGLWRALDDDGAGHIKGYISRGDFFTFMRRAHDDGEGGEGKASGWRERLTAARREAAAAVKEMKHAGAGKDDPEAMAGWRADMMRVQPATDGQMRAFARELNVKLGSTWYKAFKEMDRDGNGQVIWLEFYKMIRQLGMLHALAQEHTTAKVRCALISTALLAAHGLHHVCRRQRSDRAAVATAPLLSPPSSQTFAALSPPTALRRIGGMRSAPCRCSRKMIPRKPRCLSPAACCLTPPATDTLAAISLFPAQARHMPLQ